MCTLNAWFNTSPWYRLCRCRPLGTASLSKQIHRLHKVTPGDYRHPEAQADKNITWRLSILSIIHGFKSRTRSLDVPPRRGDLITNALASFTDEPCGQHVDFLTQLKISSQSLIHRWQTLSLDTKKRCGCKCNGWRSERKSTAQQGLLHTTMMALNWHYTRN